MSALQSAHSLAPPPSYPGAAAWGFQICPRAVLLLYMIIEVIIMSLIDLAVCLIVSFAIEGLLVQSYCMAYGRRVYKIVESYHLFPKNGDLISKYDKLNRRLFSPFYKVIDLILYGVGFAILFAFVRCVYQFLGI